MIALIIYIAIIGLIVWAITTYIPMAAGFKKVIYIVADRPHRHHRSQRIWAASDPRRADTAIEVVMRLLPLILCLTLTACGGGGGTPKPLPPTRPPIVIVPPAAPRGRAVTPDEVLKAGRTNVYIGGMLLGYLLYDASLLMPDTEVHPPTETCVFWQTESDAGRVLFRRGTGNLQWCLSQFSDIPNLTVETP